MSSYDFRKNHQVTHEFIERLGLNKQLVAHDGCVNCVQWSEDGELLASGIAHNKGKKNIQPPINLIWSK